MPLVTFDQDDQLGEIVIDNPPLNLFSGDMLSDLGSAVEQAAHSKIRAVLVRAAGSDFSAGADASVFAGLDRAGAIGLEETVLSLIAAIESLPVPALALIQGQCYAGALEVCLACDLIWAAEGSQIGQIEAVAGGIPYGGGTQRIASRIGAARAAEMVFTGAVLPPETLLSWGLEPPGCGYVAGVSGKLAPLVALQFRRLGAQRSRVPVAAVILNWLATQQDGTY